MKSKNFRVSRFNDIGTALKNLFAKQAAAAAENKRLRQEKRRRKMAGNGWMFRGDLDRHSKEVQRRLRFARQHGVLCDGKTPHPPSDTP